MFFARRRHPAEIMASDLANVIQHQLTRLNLAYREKRDGVEVVQRVEFVQPLIATPDEIKIEVDVNRLPRGVTITDLRDPKVLETLSAACKRPARAEHKKGANGGFWYVVELVERSSIPRLVKFSAMRQPERAAPLLIPIGVGQQKAQRWEDLRKLPHLLIAGATGQGKSVMVNAILCQLIRRWAPEMLQIWLVDLKGGMELSYYEDLPHLPKGRFVTKSVDLPAMLADLQTEMEHRTDLMRGKARDIDDYNAHQPKNRRLPYIVLVVDEIANAMLNKSRVVLDGQKMSVAQASELLMADLAARARATGIHLIISTQRPSVEVVTGLIKANFPCRIAFGTASETDSRVIVDDSSAAGLAKGRMKFRRNMDLVELQAPYLEDSEVRDTIRQVLAGDYQPEPVMSSEDLARAEIGFLLSLAEAQAGRRFAVRELHKLAGGMVARDRIEELGARLEQEKILRKQFGPRPRVLNVSARQWQTKYPPCVLRPASGPPPAKSAPPVADMAETELITVEECEPELSPSITTFLQGLSDEQPIS
ncbi:hypothetical protein K2Z83_26315 [Oscillochloris sp. ZM17-4]|uniref:FtsK/SpoIIIE domain-containing protein n=1 Tax=Oscillochloris sp. ZM17-4 TaxID=2866714 RepID=UPI001C735AC3|nr:FtsK/SpoIIIE domain-containing protein [Oscillochloris sp. ZM17-4]MBX0331168.1 hypothetical protein [Oscillochloris sp. ZM17-4]